MSDKIAQQVIHQWQREESDSGNTMNLYQQVGDHFFLRENNITTQNQPGKDKSLPVIDPTGKQAFQKMSAGLSAVIFPSGQYFCKLSPPHESSASPQAITYLNRATEILHSELFKPSCNFILEINESIMSWAGFGTCNIQSKWDKKKLQLTFRDWDVANFRFGLDENGFPNKCYIRWSYTAEQAYDLWGDKAGEKVVDAATKDDGKRSQEKFWFIWRIQPRRERNASLKDVMNYAFEEVVVNETEKVKVDESGYEDFPCHIARWLTSSQEKWGYGQGCSALSADKELQTIAKQFNLCAELWNNPPRQTLQSFEGTPKVHPGANNIVMEVDSIRALDRNMNGNFPYSKDYLQFKQEALRDYFYVKVFAPLDNLPGDRRTTVEIIERVKAGYMQLVLPVTRFYIECLTPLVERSVMLLLRNYRIPPPPPELEGFSVEYLGRLALALQEQQADALQRFAQFSMGMEQVVPNFTVDTINTDRAGRSMATVFGVKESDLNTEEEKAAIRQKREQEMQQAKLMEAAQAAGSAYKDASGAAEDGSPAEQLMAGAE